MTTNASSFLKRGSPSKWPDELVVVTDPSLPGYDERLDAVPVTDERIRNFAAVGQIQPVSVLVVGDDLVINAGRQRWKRAMVINHIVGARPYTGKVKPVLDAIARIKGTSFAKWIADTCPNGVKLQFAVYRGDSMDAGRAAVSENEQRDEDVREAKIRKAQRMAKQGHAAEDIADAFGFGVDAAAVAKVRRWLKVDLSAPPSKPKPRGAATRPSAKALTAAATELRRATVGYSVDFSTIADLLDYAAGSKTIADIAKINTGLAEVLAEKKAKAAA